MPLTPLDIETRRFKNEMFGYRKADVEAFLRSCADALSAANLERDELQRMLKSSQGEMSNVKVREDTLIEALASAERIADERKKTAEDHAEKIVADARTRAEQMIERTRGEVSRLEQQVLRLKMERESFENKLSALIDEHRRLLDVRRQELDLADRLQSRTTRPPVTTNPNLAPPKPSQSTSPPTSGTPGTHGTGSTGFSPPNPLKPRNDGD